ncbi:hypothetical protein AMELA_G00242440 [Ameiurus melas]|uniref:Ig-like domain-containing protein n=1 Tax=Ameiurus melas TaxID=219545 RepID=A0A7J5ZZQ6_AMEME|nr:hypothetical protein AMELA_G00242440 [Ameiurus melas]
MEHCSAIIEVLFYLSVSLQISSADRHTFQYIYTALRPAINFPEFIAVGLMDGEQFVSYDSNIKIMNPKTKWIQKIEADDADYWDSQTGKQLYEQDLFKFKLNAVMQLWSLNQTEVPPTASVFQKHSSSPEVVCHATGFFPETVMITWQKDGEDVYEDVDLGETLPNQDGSFQKRSILTVSAEDLQKHTYTCVIQHSSLGEKMVLELPKGPNKLQIYSER